MRIKEIAQMDTVMKSLKLVDYDCPQYGADIALKY